jgi:hypothetical protein
LAIAKPIPAVDAVTMATFPSNLPDIPLLERFFNNKITSGEVIYCGFRVAMKRLMGSGIIKTAVRIEMNGERRILHNKHTNMSTNIKIKCQKTYGLS